MSHKDLREQFIEQIIAKNYIEAYKLLQTDANQTKFELAEVNHTFEDKPVSIMEYLILHYDNDQPLDAAQEKALLQIIDKLGTEEYNNKTTALIRALDPEFILINGCLLAIKLYIEGADINDCRNGQYKPLAFICNEIEKNPSLKEKYDDFVKVILESESELELSENGALIQDKRVALRKEKHHELVKKRLLPLWVRLINLGYRDEINAYYQEKFGTIDKLLLEKNYAQATEEIEKNPALADMLMNKASSLSDYVFSCLPRCDENQVEEAAIFLAVVAKLTANVNQRLAMTNNALENISQAESVDADLLIKYKKVVKTMLNKGLKISSEVREGLIRLGFNKTEFMKWAAPPTLSPARSRASSSLSRSRGLSSSHLSRSTIALNDNSKRLAEALVKLNFDQAESIIHKDYKLALQDLVFEGGLGSLSPARYLVTRYPDCNLQKQKEIRDFILELNNSHNKLYSFSATQNDVFESVKDMIKTSSERDEDFKEKTQSLLDFIIEQEIKPSESSDESDVGVDEDKPLKEEASMINIVENTIKDCLANFKSKEFDLDDAVTILTRDTMNYAQTVSLDDLTEIVKRIENTIVHPKDKRWEQLRQVVGAIVNKTADHYIEENKQVTSTFHITLWLCLTIIGALVPLFYYFLKVKPTRESSPLVVYEMTKTAFDQITAKPKTVDEMTPRGSTVHREDGNSSAASRRLEKLKEKQPHLISHRTEDKPEGHLKRCTFFSKSQSSNVKLFNGSLDDNAFAYRGKVPVNVRCISLKGVQADKFAEKIDGLEDEIRGQVILVS